MTENQHEAKMAHPRMAAGALFFNDQGHVLMVEPVHKHYRDIPGGYVEVGESPLQTCVREVREELGSTPPIGRLLVVDWAPNPGEGDKVLYVFDGGLLVSDDRVAIRLQREEVRAMDFHPVEAIDGLTIPRLARRVRAAVQAREEGITRYLEHGQLRG